MKLLSKIITVGVLVLSSLCFFSCANYIDELSIAGYTYSLTDVLAGNDSTLPGYAADPWESTIKFEKDGSSVTWTVKSNSYKGTYSVNQQGKTIIMNLTSGEELVWSYSGNGKILSIVFSAFEDGDISYSEQYGNYEFIYELQ